MIRGDSVSSGRNAVARAMRGRVNRRRAGAFYLLSPTYLSRQDLDDTVTTNPFAGPFDSLPAAALRWEARPAPANERHTLDQALTLDRFLTSVEKRAFRIARIAVRHDEDALDIVQDAMLQLARRYAQRPSEEWRPLFYRILQNRIRDCQRRRKVRSGVMSWLPWRADEPEADDPIASVPDAAPLPSQQAITEEALRVLEAALADLPARQQQAFMLRNFEELDVAGTALAMGCSAGSVKTHYSRAVHTLRERLGEVW